MTSQATTVPVPDGLVLAPFRALRYDAARVGDLAAVTSPPYDVIDDDDVAELEARSPYNVVRLILPRDEPEDPGSRYRRAARTLRDWRQGGVLLADPAPALYVYEETAGGHVQRGLLGGVGLAAFDAGIVLPHENTMAGPVADRLALMNATGSDLEPIFLVYDGGGGAAAAAVAGADDRPPLVSLQTDDGVRHRLWALTDPEQLAGVAADLHPRRAVIADGHHRYTTYLQRQAEHHGAGHGAGPWDFGLVLLVDTSAFGPEVHPIHRVIPGLPVAEAARRAEAGFAVRRLDPAAGSPPALLATLAEAGGTGPAFLLAGGGNGSDRYLLTDPDPDRLAAAVPAGRSAAWRDLDVTVAHHLLIRDLWGLEDTEDVVGYRHDVAASLASAERTGGTALLLNPTPVQAVAAVAAADDRMPRKSTLFTPKPRTGLVLRAFADQPGAPRR